MMDCYGVFDGLTSYNRSIYDFKPYPRNDLKVKNSELDYDFLNR